MFSPTCYVEMQDHPFLRLPRLRVSYFFQGLVIGLWLGIFAFNTDTPYLLVGFASRLTISRNPKLKSIATLADDIQKVFQLRFGTENKIILRFAPEETGEEKKITIFTQKGIFPCLIKISTILLSLLIWKNYWRINKEMTLYQISEAKLVKKKRAATEHVARIALSDLAKYFDLPIVEASRNLKVGLTVLKRKCREFGIPRWPHRKIKSLDTLIHNLQEEAERQDKAAAMAVAKRQRMLEKEREGIEKRPSMEIQIETKKFRQDVFKRRHRERALTKANVLHPTQSTDK